MGFATSPNVTLQGAAAGDAFGSSVAIGDVTGDGVDDLIVGSPNSGTNDTGRFDVFAGSASGVGTTAAWGKAASAISANYGVRMGDKVAVGGDINGDGIGDILARASGDGASKPGRAYVWLGGTTAPASYFVLKLGGAVADNYGAAISTVGDVDGDGFADFAVGVPGLKKIELYRGASAGGSVVLSDWASGTHGVDLAADHGAGLAAGDFNGDGYGDLLGAGTGKGVMYFGNAEAEFGRGIVARAVTSGAVRIRPGSYSDTTNSFTVRVTAANPFGPARVKLQVEAKPFGTAFNGTGFVQSTSWTTLATHTATATLDVAITGLAASSGYRWRARLLYDATLAPPQSHSPWHYGGLHGQRIGVHVRTTCAGTDTDGDHYCDSTDADDDGDFVLDGADCAPLDGAIYPGATDVGDNGVDEDCSGRDATYCKQDQDFDGYGNDYMPWEYDLDGLCDSGWSDNATDCDDMNNASYPGNPEVCDSIDNNCVGGADEGDVCATPSTWYRDADEDGYGDASITQVAVSKPNGYVAVAGDCNDTTSLVRPGVAEQCNGVDDDCDAGTADGSSVFGIGTACDGDDTDVCEEGVWVCSGVLGVECTDGAGSAVEVCNGLDDDCNGTPDDGLTSVTYYRDADADTYGDAGNTSVSCAQPVGYVANSLDCDDSSAATKPGVTDPCDGTDNDCDGSTDEDAASSTYYVDVDGDGWGNAGVSTSACSAPVGYAVVSGDCDDNVPTVNPDAVEACNTVDDDCDGATADGVDEIWLGAGCDGADTDACVEAVYTCAAGVQTCNDTADNDIETCDGVDNDCNGLVDDGFTVSAWYRDEDGDAYGTAATTLDACVQPVGYVAASGDCNDADGNVNPGRAEVCNGVDDDCDGTPDDGLTLGTYYADADGDGQGTSTSSQSLCTATAGWVANSTDCDDTNETIYSGAVEVCDGLDNDCDLTPDDGLTFATYYLDGDADGYGLSSSSVSACAKPIGYSTVSGDCNDASASVKPGVAEACDGVDNDCDGGTADGASEAWLGQSCDGADTDACNEAVMVCSAGAPLCPDTGDDDVEVCDGIDNDCDGTPDDGLALTAYFRDADGDGYGTAADSVFACAQAAGWVLNATDCADADVARNPGATETCNDVDDDCDGTPDDGLTQTAYYRDADGDGYGDAMDLVADCSQPAGRVGNATDCADTDAARNPGATEACDGVDNDCDGMVDSVTCSTSDGGDTDGGDIDGGDIDGGDVDPADTDPVGDTDPVSDTDAGDGGDSTDPSDTGATGDVDTTPTDDDTSGGNDGGAASGGCSCSARSSGDEGLVWWLGALLVPWMRRRRRA